MKAVRADGGWKLTGQKVWTSAAQRAHWGVCLARTDPDAPKNQGISYLVVDMRDPGVEVRPLHQITDECDFNEVFFSDVFVPEDRIIGPEHEGWQVANQTLTHERGVNPRQLVVHTQLVEELLRLANDNGSFDDHRRAQRLAEAFVEVQIFRLHYWRSISRTAKGEAPGPVGTINKVWWSEMSKRLHDTAMTVLGPAAPLWRGASDNPGEGAWQRSWLYYQASSIWAGTNEIQRNLIGERALGLPREPRPTPRSK
jgi:alkylation response protein AidB-like acyl-CoA dehydrogenase